MIGLMDYQLLQGLFVIATGLEVSSNSLLLRNKIYMKLMNWSQYILPLY